jgi:hypothetical protein
MIRLKILFPDGFSIYLENHHHKSAHQKRTVCLLVELVRAIVVNAVIFELWVLYYSFYEIIRDLQKGASLAL